jgi:hypothetical protein
MFQISLKLLACLFRGDPSDTDPNFKSVKEPDIFTWIKKAKTLGWSAILT